METQLTINLPDDFRIVCDIFQIKPEVFIQKFLETASLPYYYSDPECENKWAALFLLKYLKTYHMISNEDFLMHQPFLDQLAEIISIKAVETVEERNAIEIRGRDIIREWHEHLSAIRAK